MGTVSGGSSSDVVAVVTGAARGVGRGAALALGELGATVYVADREARAHRCSPLSGTIEDTAEQVDERGGRGVPVRVDVTDDAAVEGLFQRVRAEHGGLDLLVANAFDGNALPFAGGPFWTLPWQHWHNMFVAGVRGHALAAWHGAPLLIERGGLAVFTGYAHAEEDVLAGHLFYDLAMTTISRLAYGLAQDLRPYGATALAVSPGFTRTEAIVAAFGGAPPPGLDSIEFPGRAIRALLQDPDVGRHAGRTLLVADLAAVYGFSDVPDPAAME
jgi:NAD(P)-dependent dehydrogenase (short-subunit alcohol dehydrogenase family)